MCVGLRDWFRKTPASSPSEVDGGSAVDVASEARTFAELQAQRAEEALSLFEEHEVEAADDDVVEAPYDAGQADLEALMSEDIGQTFTHIDEVEIDDVNDLDDPYLEASVEGDVPQPVRFEEWENPVSD